MPKGNSVSIPASEIWISPASLLDVPHQPVRIPEQHSKLGGFPAEGQAGGMKP